MSDEINLFISNGTCYTRIDLEADEAMIPCGNDANDHVACCQAGDKCLESSVCFNAAFGVTYMAGCSDPNYEHPSCPNKFEHIETPWVGMAYCNGTSNEWKLCDQKKKPATLTKPDYCYCPQDKRARTELLSQSSIIPGTASLPTEVFGSIQFSVGYYPTLNPDRTTTATTASSTDGSESSSAPSSAPSSPSPTAEATPTGTFAPYNLSPGTGLSPNAKIATIAGGVAGALLIAILLVAFLCFRRRQRKRQLQIEEENRAVDDFMHGETKSGAASEPDPLSIGIASTTTTASSSSPHTPALSELDTKAARPWSLRSELGGGGAPSARSSYGTSPGHGGSLGQGGSPGQGGTGGHAARPAPSELAAHPIAELPG